VTAPSLLVLDDARHVGLTAAELVANRIRARTRLRMLLPTGHTPRGLYAALRGQAADGSLPSDHVTVLGLDEYLGLDRDDPLSFHADLDRELAGIPIGRREALDGAAADAAVEAARYEAVLDAAPIDLAVLGLGRDAHVAFNEPGSSPGAGVHRVALHPSTIAAAAADFGGAERVPREALTVGLKTLLGAREILLMVTGAEKADALRAALEGPVDAKSPASLLRHHPCMSVIADRAAAAQLRPTANRNSDHVAIVLGHREPGISAEHRISAHSRARLSRVVRLCRSTPVRPCC
jgi:glucosamine-6-phosphate deaminase